VLLAVWAGEFNVSHKVAASPITDS